MPFTVESQIIAAELKKKITLSAILEEIKTNTSVNYANETPSDKRPMPSGKASPFMIIVDKPTDISIAEPLCKSLDISSSDVYLTSIIKYPTSEAPLTSVGKEHAKEFLHKEIFAVEPQIIFLVGEYARSIFGKAYPLYDETNPSQKISIALKVGKDVDYIVRVVYISSFDCAISKNILSLTELVKLDWKFVHLHCHNSLSLKDGIGSPASRVKWHADRNKPAVATTNHGNISDWYKIYEGAREHDMMPMLGIEAYFNREGEALQKIIQDDSLEAIQNKKKIRTLNRHITLFAKNEIGFFNLMKVSNDAWLNRFYRVPIVSPESLEKHKEGILCLSGCSNGEQNKIITDKYYLISEERKKEVDILIADKLKSMSTLINTKNDTRASKDEYLDEHDMSYYYIHQTDKKLNKVEYEAYAREFIAKSDEEKIASADKKIEAIIDWWHGVFGDDYYIELMAIDYEPQHNINNELIKLATKKNIPIVLTNDCHYLTKAESKVQELQMLSDQEKTFKDLAEDTEGKIWTIRSSEFYYKSVDELHDAWETWCKSDVFTEEKFWEAINNTCKIVEKFSTWELDRTVKLPKLYEKEETKKLLIKKCMDGMKKYDLMGKKEYEEQLRYELKVIFEKGYADYFLIVEDIVSWIKQKYGRLAVGPGRGSAAGGIVNYLIGLTYVDPLKYGLLFERFLDPSREDLPDIDQDIEPRIRDDVIQHMVDTYGAKSVCSIGTYGVLKTRSAILDAARVCGIPAQESFAVTKELPMDLDETKSLEEIEAEYPTLKAFLDKNTTDKMPLRFFVSSIRGAQKSIGTHAAGVLISCNVLEENIPLIRSKKTTVTGWIDGADGRELSGLNYAKMDVLGLKNLEVIHDTIDLVKERKGVDVDVDIINLDDPKVYEKVVNVGDNLGVFQFESGLGKQLIEKIHPDNMMELSDISSMMRPGPLKMGIPDMYADRKFGRAGPDGKVWTEKDIPECIRSYLRDTKGCIIFQEQCMKIPEAIGGLTRGETNKFRKLLIKYGKFSKGNPEYEKNIGKYHKKFIETASKKEYLGSEKAAEDLFSLMASFAQYGFNRSHSVSYSKVSAIEYWLKCYYPAEFNVALLNNTDVKKAKKGESVMAQYIASIASKGTKILRPSINYSDRLFSLDDKDRIKWGLSAIKGVSTPVIDKIMEERKKSNFADMQDALDRVGKKYLNKRSVEALIWSGAMDDFLVGELKTRFDLHKHFFMNIRQEKVYEDPDDAHSKSFIIKKEIELCKFSLTEMSLFVKARKKFEEESGKRSALLYEIEEPDTYMCVCAIEKRETKTSKKKTPFVSFTLRDDSAICSGLSYFHSWGFNPEEDEDKTEKLEKGKLYLFTIQKNETGFKNVKSFREL